MSISLNSPNVEWRRAYDGCPYTFDQFFQWYAEAALKVWNDSPEVRQHVDGIWYTNEEHDEMLRFDAELDEYVLDGLLADATPIPQVK